MCTRLRNNISPGVTSSLGVLIMVDAIGYQCKPEFFKLPSVLGIRNSRLGRGVLDTLEWKYAFFSNTEIRTEIMELKSHDIFSAKISKTSVIKLSTYHCCDDILVNITVM